MSKHNVARRRFLVATGLVTSAPLLALGKASERIDSDKGVTAPEDLMKEHGVLNRCLVYRPHEAREDTVLFPALRTILKPKAVEKLGDRMEEDEEGPRG